jgi:hypothetical protein
MNPSREPTEELMSLGEGRPPGCRDGSAALPRISERCISPTLNDHQNCRLLLDPPFFIGVSQHPAQSRIQMFGSLDSRPAVNCASCISVLVDLFEPPLSREYLA